MIAPHSLALHGNLAGAWGPWLPLGLILAAAVHQVSFFARTRLNSQESYFAEEFAAYCRGWGAVSAVVAPLAGRLVTALAGATGLLVTAGFAFNETFVYWFPNFAFAYILLGTVLLLHLAGQSWVQAAQQLFTMAALGGLLLLMGIALNGPGTELPPSGTDGASLSIRSWPLFLLLFVGLDLAFLNRTATVPAGADVWAHLVWGLAAATLIFMLWGWVAIRFVSPHRLVDSTIAPVLVAKQVWGQSGRYTMGVVTIAGTLAAVNALFSGVATIVDTALRQTGMVDPEGRTKLSPTWTVFILGAATAALMALGMAGTDKIDVALRAGLVLWLLNYALIPIVLLCGTPPDGVPKRIVLVVAGGVMLAGGLALIFYDPERMVLLYFIAAAVLVLTLLGAGGVRLLAHKLA